MLGLEIPDETPYAVSIYDWRVERAFPGGPFVTGWTLAAQPAWNAVPLEVSVAWGAADALDPSQPLNEVYYPVGSIAGGLPSWTLGTTFMPGLAATRNYADGIQTIAVSALFDDGSRIDDTLRLLTAANRTTPWTRNGTEGIGLIFGAPATTRWTGAAATPSCSAATGMTSCSARPGMTGWPAASGAICSTADSGRTGLSRSRMGRRTSSSSPPRPRAAT